MFRGVNVINLDTKWRLAIPARYRQVLLDRCDGAVVVTIDTDEPCLLIYPLEEWELIQQKIEALPSFHPMARRIQRLLIGHAADVELDRNGRILIPHCCVSTQALKNAVFCWDRERSLSFGMSVVGANAVTNT